MGDFWYPYASLGDASIRIARFVDQHFGPACGITWSDGQRVSLLRRPQMAGGHGKIINVLRTRVSAPPPPQRPSSPVGFVDRAKALFWHVMEIEGQAEIANAQAQMAASQAMVRVAHDDLWEPVHRWMIAHKKTADGIGVAIDVIGVAAAVVFVVTFAPEIGAAAAVVGAVAAASSTLLFVIDGTVFATEMLGYKDASETVENNSVVQWTRLIATGLTLVDIPVGGVRALVEVGKLGREIEESAAVARTGESVAAAARARIAKIRNPAKHPAAVARRTHQLNRVVAEVEAQHRTARVLGSRLARTRYFDAPATLGATPAGAAVLAAAPPSVALNRSQLKRDEDYLKSLEPAGGMPRDVSLHMRASTVGKVRHGG